MSAPMTRHDPYRKNPTPVRPRIAPRTQYGRNWRVSVQTTAWPGPEISASR